MFFTSLLSILFMLWRKVALVKSGQYYITEDASFEIPYLKEARKITLRSIKKYEHAGLVMIVKSYLQLSNFLKNKARELNVKIQNMHVRNHSTGELIEKVEASKFLKIVSAYKRKISEITHKIREEEKEENNL